MFVHRSWNSVLPQGRRTPPFTHYLPRFLHSLVMSSGSSSLRGAVIHRLNRYQIARRLEATERYLQHRRYLLSVSDNDHETNELKTNSFNKKSKAHRNMILMCYVHHLICMPSFSLNKFSTEKESSQQEVWSYLLRLVVALVLVHY